MDMVWTFMSGVIMRTVGQTYKVPEKAGLSYMVAPIISVSTFKAAGLIPRARSAAASMMTWKCAFVPAAS